MRVNISILVCFDVYALLFSSVFGLAFLFVFIYLFLFARRSEYIGTPSIYNLYKL